MHHRNILPGIIVCVYFAGIRKSCLFFHGKRVELGAQHNCGSRPILQNRNNTSSPDMLGYVIAELPQPGC